MPSKGPQVRAWMFTINTPGDIDPTSWSYTYLIYQEEIGEQGRQHIQGYVVVPRKATLAAMKKLHPTAHWEPRSGTHDEAVHYCSKPVKNCECKHCVKAREGYPNVCGPYIFGEAPSQGKRTDLLEIKTQIEEGKSAYELWNDNFATMVRYAKGIMHFYYMSVKPRNFAPQVAVLFGPTGTGKSSYVYKEIPEHKSYWVNRPRDQAGAPWFNGYDPRIHEHLVIDEFYGWVKLDWLLRLLDRYPMHVDVKGDMVPFTCKYIWITSNKPPVEWYDWDKLHASYATLERRFNLVIECPADGQQIVRKSEFPPEPDEELWESTFDEDEEQLEQIDWEMELSQILRTPNSPPLSPALITPTTLSPALSPFRPSTSPLQSDDESLTQLSQDSDFQIHVPEMFDY